MRLLNMSKLTNSNIKNNTNKGDKANNAIDLFNINANTKSIDVVDTNLDKLVDTNNVNLDKFVIQKPHKLSFKGIKPKFLWSNIGKKFRISSKKRLQKSRKAQKELKATTKAQTKITSTDDLEKSTLYKESKKSKKSRKTQKTQKTQEHSKKSKKQSKHNAYNSKPADNRSFIARIFDIEKQPTQKELDEAERKTKEAKLQREEDQRRELREFSTAKLLDSQTFMREISSASIALHNSDIAVYDVSIDRCDGANNKYSHIPKIGTQISENDDEFIPVVDPRLEYVASCALERIASTSKFVSEMMSYDTDDKEKTTIRYNKKRRSRKRSQQYVKSYEKNLKLFEDYLASRGINSRKRCPHYYESCHSLTSSQFCECTECVTCSRCSIDTEQDDDHSECDTDCSICDIWSWSERCSI